MISMFITVHTHMNMCVLMCRSAFVFVCMPCIQACVYLTCICVVDPWSFTSRNSALPLCSSPSLGRGVLVSYTRKQLFGGVLEVSPTSAPGTSSLA